MSISAELQARYSTECDVDWADALVIRHPAIVTRYWINHPEQQTGLVEEALQTFAPVPFKLRLPTRDSSGRQDMALVISNVGSLGTLLMDEARADLDSPLAVDYTIFLLGDPTPQLDPPIRLTLTGISLTDTVLTATATRADVFNLNFPREVYRPTAFPGLNRR